MILKKNKVDKNLFKEVFNKGKKYNSKYFLAKVSPLPESVYSKVSAVIPSKIVKKATERNRLRRIIYIAFKEYISNIKSPKVFIFILKKGKQDIDKNKLKEDLKELIENIEKTT